MATLNQVRTRIDIWLTNKWPTVVARQQNFFTNRGKYWQGLLTHSVPPGFTTSQDGDALADKLNQSPTDQFENWSAVFPEWNIELMPCAIKCDTYDGPDGKGYCVTIYVRYNGVIYSRAQNVGPESHRTYGWRAEEPA